MTILRNPGMSTADRGRMKQLPLVLVPFFSLLIGCGSSAESSAGTGAADVDFYCASACDKQVECDSKSDRDTCVNSCKTNNATSVSHLRADFVNALTECMNAADCKSLLTGESECAEKIIAKAAPSPAGEVFCAEYAKQGDKCGFTRTESSCLEITKFYDDDSMSAAEACLNKACPAQDPCVLAAFGK